MIPMNVTKHMNVLYLSIKSCSCKNENSHFLFRNRSRIGEILLLNDERSYSASSSPSLLSRRRLEIMLLKLKSVEIKIIKKEKKRKCDGEWRAEKKRHSGNLTLYLSHYYTFKSQLRMMKAKNRKIYGDSYSFIHNLLELSNWHTIKLNSHFFISLFHDFHVFFH